MANQQYYHGYLDLLHLIHHFHHQLHYHHRPHPLRFPLPLHLLLPLIVVLYLLSTLMCYTQKFTKINPYYFFPLSKIILQYSQLQTVMKCYQNLPQFIFKSWIKHLIVTRRASYINFSLKGVIINLNTLKYIHLCASTFFIRSAFLCWKFFLSSTIHNLLL
jgi:hypothetical protein